MNNVRSANDKMTTTVHPFSLHFKHPFSISYGTRTSTPVVYVEVEQNGIIAYGEAAMPPYLSETIETAKVFLSKINLSKYSYPFNMDHILKYVDNIADGNTAAKAAVDIALHDLYGKLSGRSLSEMFGTAGMQNIVTTFTLGISEDISKIAGKVNEASGFKMLKVKLGRENDKQIILTIRQHTDMPLCVDANQGWKDKNYALEMAHWLAERNCILVEQPLPKNRLDDSAWLTERSPLPVIADEAVQRLCDLEKIKGACSGVNIKLMKCTGLHEAYKMIVRAKELGMKVFIGCMSESSCGATAAAHLSPLADWADLDGPWLINNDPFDGMKIKDGFIALPDRAGIGIIPNEKYPGKR